MRLIKEKTSIDFLSQTRRKVAWRYRLFSSLRHSCLWRPAAWSLASISRAAFCWKSVISRQQISREFAANLSDAGYSNAQVQRFGADEVVLVRLPPQEGDVDEIRDALQRYLQAVTRIRSCGVSNLSVRRSVANLPNAVLWR